MLTDRRFHRLALVCAAAGICLALAVWGMGYGPEDAKAAWKSLEEFMRHRPWLLFVAIVILPGFPAPISPVMLLAGVVFHKHPILVCFGCLVALELNLVWTYWVGRKPGRSLVQWMFEKAKVEVPTVAAENEMKWLLIVRLTPGFPLFIQSYLLGFVGISFFRYLWVSLACSGSIACGMVLTGAGVGDGRIGFILGGFSALIVVAVVLKIVGKKVLRA